MSEVTGCRSEPGAPSTCLASRGPESRFSHGPGYDHHHLWGAITLVISPAHLPLTVSLGSLGNDPWDSSPVPPEYPLCSTAPQECLSRDPRRGPPPQNTPRPPREPLAQPLTSLALALSVACPIQEHIHLLCSSCCTLYSGSSQAVGTPCNCLSEGWQAEVMFLWLHGSFAEAVFQFSVP